MPAPLDFETGACQENPGRPAPTVAAAIDRFVVTWVSLETSYKVKAQRFDSNGTIHGDELAVGDSASVDQENPSVAVERDGSFLVAWEKGTVEMQRLNSNGSFAGDRQQVNTEAIPENSHPEVAAGACGEIGVVWDSHVSAGGDDASRSVQGQLFVVPNIFGDGFETGDVSSWTSVSGL